MKFKSFVILFALVALNSCIVKSLHPFYTKESIAFEKSFIGKWKDNKGDIWNVKSFQDMFNEDFVGEEKPSEEDLKTLEKIKHNYLVEYVSQGRKAFFMATPFKIKDQLLLNFTPYSHDDAGINSLLSSHLLNTHSVVKFDIVNNSEIDIKWLDEERIEDLLKTSKIRVKHEIIGIQEDFLLTANSTELYQFLEKYLASNIENKWKSSSEFKLKKLNV